MNRDSCPIRVEIAIAPGRAAPAGSPSPPEAATRGGPSPPIDIHEGPGGLILEADLPGATGDGVSIRLEEHVLVLRARVGPRVPEGAQALYEEARPGEIHRAFILSGEVDPTRITAELAHGVLRLTLPRAERRGVRRIEVTSR